MLCKCGLIRKFEGDTPNHPQNYWNWTEAKCYRWKDENKAEGVKWNYLEHNGPLFAPPYEPLPDNVHFYYNGKEMKLSEPTEEVAVFYGRMLDHDYTTKEVFNNNFFKDWRKASSCMIEHTKHFQKSFTGL